MKKALQYLSDDSLKAAARAKPEEIVEFVEGFRELHAAASRSRLISLRVPEALLNGFRLKARRRGLPYQTQIKRLMEEWLRKA